MTLSLVHTNPDQYALCLEYLLFDSYNLIHLWYMYSCISQKYGELLKLNKNISH